MINHLDAIVRFAEARSRFAGAHSRSGRHPGCYDWLSAVGLDTRRR